MNVQDSASLSRGKLRERSSKSEKVQVCVDSSKHAPEAYITPTMEKIKQKKTFGRTPNGTIFTVPYTHDMVSQLLDPRQPKNLSDVFVLLIISIHIISFYFLTPFLRQLVFAIIFLFWRSSYNLGIGYLLHMQSNSQQLVKWALRTGLGIPEKEANNENPWYYSLIKRELEAKIPEDYQFEKAPIEYNTWLIFRRVVDLILMCDFTSYCLFAIACSHRPAGEGLSIFIARWTIGMLLVGFNLWVKLDAHRVVKDYAWYWGDFFFLVDQKLTFDGVFEMAPHPMYSVGYAGYYGISMMAASYSVLFISIIAHAAQFGFLIHVENPHIEKTYNSPIRKRDSDIPHCDRFENSAMQGNKLPLLCKNDLAKPDHSPFAATDSISVHSYVGLGSLDLFRTTELSCLLLQVLIALLTVLTPSTPGLQAFFIFGALFWRLWYTVGLGVILDRQSKLKIWTRHFVKYGETTEVAWKEWKGLYHLSMTMCYASFIAASWKMYSLPEDWGYGLVLFKHVLGVGLIALQAWTANSIYESLGEFGWYFGDFFFDKGTKLTYSGIYRYLNNPERIMGLASVWGAVLITGSPAIFFLALISHILTFGFIQLVEKPHMQKLYGRNLRSEAGLTKSIRRSLPPPLQKIQGSVDKVLEETSNFIREFVDAAQPKFASGVSTFVRDTSSLFSQYPARITLTRLAPDLAGYDPRDYSLEIEGASLSMRTSERVTGKESFRGRFPQSRFDQYEPLMFEYGTPITVNWKAPLYCSKKDWIGLYMIADNASREVTRVSSAGRWIPNFFSDYHLAFFEKEIIASHKIVRGEIQADGSIKDYIQGKMIFEGDKLWWTQGVFEFRYHHDGKHNVMAISLPFEIFIRKFTVDGLDISDSLMVQSEIEKALLPLVRNCFDQNIEIAPNSVEESFGTLIERDGKYAKRVVFAVHQMFGIELAPKVVLADGNVRKLAWRVYVAKQALVSAIFLPLVSFSLLVIIIAYNLMIRRHTVCPTPRVPPLQLVRMSE